MVPLGHGGTVRATVRSAGMTTTREGERATRTDPSAEQQLAAERAARARAHATAERLEQENRAKDDFLSELAHELRTPLTAILGWASLLRQRQFDPSVVARGLETIEMSARAQAQLIDDLSDLSRVVSGKLRLEMRPMDLRLALQTALEAARPSAEAKGVRLECSTPSTTCPVKGDRDRLQQVIGNLLTNAVKFTPEGGTVTLTLESTGDHVRLSVTDTGIGIPSQFLPYVFDRFRQADSSSTRAHGGLGLGLAIVRHLVQLHGGTVSASSDGDGHGSRFTIELPEAAASRDRSDDARPAGRDERPAGPLLAGLKLLLVEDDDASRETIAALLEQEGAEVTATASVDEAVRALEAARPDVVVSDIRMPGQDGYALIRRLREAGDTSGPEIPAVALTGFGRDSDRSRAISEGFQMHLAKPVDGKRLAGAVASLLRQPAGTDSVEPSIEEELDQALQTSAREDRPLAVLRVEVDDLARIRAVHGGAGVDTAVRSCLAAARGVLRTSDLITTCGPGRFVVFARGADSEGAFRAAERIRAAASSLDLRLPDGRSIAVTVSVGASTAAPAAADAAELLSSAEDALHRARERGGNQVDLAGPSPEGATGRPRSVSAA